MLDFVAGVAECFPAPGAFQVAGPIAGLLVPLAVRFSFERCSALGAAEIHGLLDLDLPDLDLLSAARCLVSRSEPGRCEWLVALDAWVRLRGTFLRCGIAIEADLDLDLLGAASCLVSRLVPGR